MYFFVKLSPTSGTSKKIIDWTGNWGAKMTSIAVYNGGLVLSGPDGSLRVRVFFLYFFGVCISAHFLKRF